MKTIVEMTREAGGFDATPEFLERFADLVRADAIADERKRQSARSAWVGLTRQQINQMMADAGWQNSAIRQADLDKVEKVARAIEALVRADERNRLAKECALLPFGDTAASFAVWIKNGGKP